MMLEDFTRESDWRDQAACLGSTHLFFAPAAERPQARARRESAARTICSNCVVRVDCAEYASSRAEYGFWGGLSEDERYSMGIPIGYYAEKYVKRHKNTTDL